jgi:hypothetical protein
MSLPRTALTAILVFVSVNMFGQVRGGPPRTPKAMAPADLTGYWEAIVVEDWRYRMLPPIKLQDPPRLGERVGIPMNAEARRIALAWDAAKDEAAGDQCKAYGAPNIMRIPGRIHVTWQDDQTMKLETDAGTQTRTFEFATPKIQPGGWQGVSQASWDTVPAGRGGAGLPSGSLKVVTSKMKAGYLMKNGIPYSANAVVTEYYDRIDELNGDSYLLITTSVEDPMYLTEPYLASTHFKKQADATGWNPSPCTTR